MDNFLPLVTGHSLMADGIGFIITACYDGVLCLHGNLSELSEFWPGLALIGL